MRKDKISISSLQSDSQLDRRIGHFFPEVVAQVISWLKNLASEGLPATSGAQRLCSEPDTSSQQPAQGMA